MSRPSQHSRRPAARAALQPNKADATSAAFAPGQDGWQRSLDMLRAMFDASLGSSRELMQGLGDLQQAHAAAIRRAGQRIGELAGRAERAPDWPSRLALQADLAGAPWTQAMQELAPLVEQVMRIEARLLERGRADATRLAQRWWGNGNGGSMPFAAAAIGPAESSGPLAMLAQARAATSEMTRLWTMATQRTALPD